MDWIWSWTKFWGEDASDSCRPGAIRVQFGKHVPTCESVLDTPPVCFAPAVLGMPQVSWPQQSERTRSRIPTL